MIPDISTTTDNIKYAISMVNRYRSKVLAAMAIEDMLSAINAMGTKGGIISDLKSAKFFIEDKAVETHRTIKHEHKILLEELHQLD